MKFLLNVIAICWTIMLLAACSNQEDRKETTIGDDEKTQLIDEAVLSAADSSDFLTYRSKVGWTVQYPKSWDYTSEGVLQETASEKYISFRTYAIPEEGVEVWLDNKIERALSMEEADNTLSEEVTVEAENGFIVYKYALQSAYVRSDNISELRKILYVDNEHIYEFHTQSPPLTNAEFEAIVGTFTFENEKDKQTVEHP